MSNDKKGQGEEQTPSAQQEEEQTGGEQSGVVAEVHNANMSPPAVMSGFQFLREDGW